MKSQWHIFIKCNQISHNVLAPDRLFGWLLSLKHPFRDFSIQCVNEEATPHCASFTRIWIYFKSLEMPGQDGVCGLLLPSLIFYLRTDRSPGTALQHGTRAGPPPCLDRALCALRASVGSVAVCWLSC